MGMELSTHCPWFFGALQPRGLCWGCVISQFVMAAAGTGSMAGLTQPRNRAVSNKSCSFSLEWMIWRSLFSLEAHLYSAKGASGWTSVGVPVWPVGNTVGCWRGAEAEAPRRRGALWHSLCQCGHGQHTALGTEGSSLLCERQKATWAVWLSQRFHAPYGHCLGRRRCCPHQLSLLSISMGN